MFADGSVQNRKIGGSVLVAADRRSQDGAGVVLQDTDAVNFIFALNVVHIDIANID